MIIVLTTASGWCSYNIFFTLKPNFTSNFRIDSLTNSIMSSLILLLRQLGTFSGYAVYCLNPLTHTFTFFLWSVYSGLDCIHFDGVLLRCKYERLFLSLETIFYWKLPLWSNNCLCLLKKKNKPWNFCSFNLSCHFTLCYFLVTSTFRASRSPFTYFYTFIVLYLAWFSIFPYLGS